jgi:hypothetical protein
MTLEESVEHFRRLRNNGTVLKQGTIPKNKEDDLSGCLVVTLGIISTVIVVTLAYRAGNGILLAIEEGLGVGFFFFMVAVFWRLVRKLLPDQKLISSLGLGGQSRVYAH